jgi:hypothetical protein
MAIKMDQDLVSFVIRFVRETSDSEQARWRGLIKHVQSNHETAFTEFVDALAFMQDFVNLVVQSGLSESQQVKDEENILVNPLLETTRLWGDFMPAYAKTMSAAMGEMMETMSAQSGPKPMQQAMDNTLTAWGLPTRIEQERTAAALEAMNHQLAEMNTKLVDLENQIAELKS